MNDESFIARMKKRSERKGITKYLCPPTIYLYYDDDTDSVFPCFEGKILNKDLFDQIFSEINKFYSKNSIDYIADLNDILSWYWENDNQKRPNPKNVKPGYVYLLKAENGLYKIGRTTNLNARTKYFEIKLPVKWELIYSFYVEDSLEAERKLHEYFKSSRRVGEWFELSENDVEIIKTIKDGEL